MEQHDESTVWCRCLDKTILAEMERSGLVWREKSHSHDTNGILEKRGGRSPCRDVRPFRPWQASRPEATGFRPVGAGLSLWAQGRTHALLQES